MSDDQKVLCPRCPVCNGRAAPHLPCNLAQAFCQNNDCRVITWQPGKSLDDNLTDANFLDFNL